MAVNIAINTCATSSDYGTQLIDDVLAVGTRLEATSLERCEHFLKETIENKVHGWAACFFLHGQMLTDVHSF